MELHATTLKLALIVITKLIAKMMLGSRRSQTAKSSSAPVKYCSDRCKRNKPSALDRRIEEVFAALLEGQDISHFAPTSTATTNSNGNDSTDDTTTVQAPAISEAVDFATRPVPNADVPRTKPPAMTKGKPQKLKKGETRIIVPCSQVESLLFPQTHDPEKTFGRRRNRARRGVPDDEVWKSVDMIDDLTLSDNAHNNDDNSDSDDDSGDGDGIERTDEEADHTDSSAKSIDNTVSALMEGGVRLPANHIRPTQQQSQVNGSVGGEIGWAERKEETAEEKAKRLEGVRRAEHKEMVKCAARRVVVFGLLVDAGEEKGEDGGGGGGKKGKGGKKRGKGKDVEVDVEKGGQMDVGEDGKLRRKCEAVMNGAVVEPSFAKGDWGIRWREM